jgi:hypothetical protein
MEFMNADGYNSSGQRSDKLFDTLRRLRIDWIKQTSRLEESRRGLVLERIVQVTVIVLVHLGVNNDRVSDTGFAREL